MAEQPDRKAVEKAQQTLFDEGMKLRGQVLGGAHIANSKELPPQLQPMQQMAVAAGWSMAWTRPGLERKTRSLLCIAMLSILNRNHELGAHTQGAIRNGATEEEILETLVQVSVYAGMPCGLESTRVAWDALQKMKESGELK